MSKINYQALREIAKQATQGEWVAFISPGKCGTYAVHTPGDKHHGDIVDWPGFDEQKNAENNARYIAVFNPEVVQALLDELEVKDKQITELTEENVALKDAVVSWSGRALADVTPATDAFLAEVRAQGVDAAIEHLHKKFEGTRTIGVPVMALEYFAAELRKGGNQ